MSFPDNLFTLYSAEIEDRNGTAVVTVPERELEVGDLAVGDTYRIAVLPARSGSGSASAGAVERDSVEGHRDDRSQPPVEEGEVREVEIGDIGDQGDGIARIGPGYVVFVPGTDIGDRVTVEITQARDNFAFAEVVEDEPLST